MSQDIVQCLMNLHKSDMQANAIHFGEDMPSSWNKEKMAQKLAQIYMENTENFLSMLSLHALLFISEVFEQKINGQVPLQSKEKKAQAMLDDVRPQLEVWGLVQYKNGGIHIADFLGEFIRKRLPSIKDIAVEMQEMENCVLGIFIAYGFIEEGQFIKILSRCFPQIEAEKIRSFIYHRTNLHLVLIYVSVEDETWWFYHTVDNMSEWYSAIRERTHIPYREYSKEEYIDMFLRGFVKTPKNFDKLVKIMCEKGMSKQEAMLSLIMEAVDYGCQLEMSRFDPEFMHELIWDSDEEIKRFFDLLMEFYNDTPLWINKGFTPRELSQRAFGPKPQSAAQRKSNVIAFPQKTGRNEPCLCGSGKKYKNCCGKEQQDE